MNGLYFLAGHVWLLAAAAIFLFCRRDREDPARVSLLGSGRQLSKREFFAVEALALAIALLMFIASA